MGFNLSGGHAEREDGEMGRLATDLQDIRISSGKEDRREKQRAASEGDNRGEILAHFQLLEQILLFRSLAGVQFLCTV